MQMQNLLLVVLVLGSMAAQAAEVLQVSGNNKVIAVSNEDSHVWRVRDNVCVYQVGQEAACGTVIKLIKQGAIVKLTSVSNPVVKGDSAAFVPASARKLASTGESMEEVSTSRGGRYGWDITAGLSLGTNYFYPMITFERALGNHLALGLTPFYVSSASNGSTVTAIGGLLTLDYYSRSAFRGLWIQAGGGVVAFNLNDGAGNVATGSSMAGLASIGYRGQFELGMNVGIGAGILYVSAPPASDISVAFQGLLPLLILDIGFNF
jgi:hypothetical protein